MIWCAGILSGISNWSEGGFGWGVRGGGGGGTFFKFLLSQATGHEESRLVRVNNVCV